jgi:hypothetical protein
MAGYSVTGLALQAAEAPFEVDRLTVLISNIIDYLRVRQRPDGEFPTVRRFTSEVGSYVTPSEFPGWHRFGACPFCTANILYHLAWLDVPGTMTIRDRAAACLERGLEDGVARYVPSSSKPISFPADIDDTCLAVVALRRHGARPRWNRRMVLANRDRDDNLLTWLIPRPRHLLHPRNYLWLRRDARIWLDGMRRRGRPAAAIERVLHEYRDSAEPGIAANVLLATGVSSRTRRFLRVLVDRVARGDMPLQYYSNLLAAYLHVARLHAAGVSGLSRLAPMIAEYIGDRQSPTGEVEHPFNTALAALTLMYFDRWQDAALHRAAEYIAAHPMHAGEWLPFHYCNDRDDVFVDGGAELTATFYLEVLFRYRQWLYARQGGRG